MAKHFVLAIVALGLVAASMGKSVELDESSLDKQVKVYKLFFHVDQAELFWPEEYGKFKLENLKNKDLFDNGFTGDEFFARYHYGLLPRGQAFSVIYKEQLEEAVSLFHVFINLKSFEDFYHFALWARLHVNELQFIYALNLAVIHRPDTQHIRVPAMYEIYPYFFYNIEVLRKAVDIRTREKGVKNENGIETYLIPANYSSWYIRHSDDHEWKLTYLTEDIDFNNFYYISRQDNAFWLKPSETGVAKGEHYIQRGEEFFFTHKQFVNRYNLERHSNDLDEIEDFSWNDIFVTGYYPSLTFQNGLPFSQRKSWSKFPSEKEEYIEEIEKFESRIEDAIDSGFIFGKDGKLVNIYTSEGFELFSNTLQGNVESYNKDYYGSIIALGRKILGFSVEPSSKYQVIPSALEIFSTSLRDPAFYRLYKRILHFFYEYKSKLPAYTEAELLAPGLKIESVTIDKLTTYFEYVDVPINNAIPVKDAPDASTFCVKVRQERLNHKPFSYHFTVKSDKATKAFIRIFLGPKYDQYNSEIDISKNWKNFVELDVWEVELAAGINKIERKSTESIYTVDRPELYSDLFYVKVKNALAKKKPISVDEQLYGFPNSLILPKGKPEGLPLEFIAYISEVKDEDLKVVSSRVWGNKVFDNKPLGFPLDRPVFSHNFTVPNLYVKDIKVYHNEAVNVSG